MSKCIENFYDFIWAKLMTYAGEQYLKCSGELSFIHLELRRVRKLTCRWEKARHGTVKGMCFLEGGYALEGSGKEDYL